MLFKINFTVISKDEKCIGDEISKLRVTVVVVCVDATNSERRELLVICTSLEPCCLKNVKMLPVVYTANYKAWMTAQLFYREISLYDGNFKKKGRKIAFLLYSVQRAQTSRDSTARSTDRNSCLQTPPVFSSLRPRGDLKFQMQPCIQISNVCCCILGRPESTGVYKRFWLSGQPLTLHDDFYM